MQQSFYIVLNSHYIYRIIRFSYNIINPVPNSGDKDLRPVYDGVELVEGWKVVGTETADEVSNNGVPKKQILTNWVERCMADSFEDARIFAIDLATSLEYRIEKCVTSGAAMCNFFDIEETFSLFFYPAESGRIKRNEGALEEHGAKEFELFFKEVCSLKHIKELNDERFDERIHSSVLHNWKACLKYFLWNEDMLTHLLACLLPQSESDVAVHRRINADIVTSLAKMKLVPKRKCELNIKNVFIFSVCQSSAI